jgi:hypothetical protein
MKTTLCFCLALAAVTGARAEIFRSGGTVWAHRGGHSAGHDRGGHHGGTVVHVGVGYGHGGYYGSPWRSAYGYYAPTYGYYSGYGYGYPYYETGYYGNGSYATNGLLLGALAGGVIGHNSGEFRHNGWRGAAWGAGLGWLLGTVADANRRPVYTTAPATAMPMTVQAPAQAAPAPQPQQVTIINNYYNSSTPMSGANSLFGR